MGSLNAGQLADRVFGCDCWSNIPALVKPKPSNGMGLPLLLLRQQSVFFVLKFSFGAHAVSLPHIIRYDNGFMLCKVIPLISASMWTRISSLFNKMFLAISLAHLAKAVYLILFASLNIDGSS